MWRSSLVCLKATLINVGDRNKNGQQKANLNFGHGPPLLSDRQGDLPLLAN